MDKFVKSVKTSVMFTLFAFLSSELNASEYNAVCENTITVFKSNQLMPEGEVKVSSDRASLTTNQEAKFEGDVEILSDTASITADSATVLNNGNRVIAQGGVDYKDNLLNVTSTSIDVDSLTRSLEIIDTEYQLTEFGGQGVAKSIDISESDGVALNGVTFTTCPLTNVDWQIKASQISFQEGSSVAEAKHARFYVKDVPVFYLPYFAYPVGTERQTGLLFPNISSSSQTGIDIEQPFYWNIAPNYDLTLTPRLTTLRGFQLKSEFRYLTESSRGTINLDFLPEDSDLEDRDSRYFYRFFHEQQLSDKWFINADFNGVSDSNYIIDLGSDFFNRADTHLSRTLGLDFLGDNFNASFYLRDFDIIAEDITTYRALPEIKVDGTYPLARYLEFQFNSEFAYFDNAAESEPKALRFHLAPTLRVPVIRPWGELSAEATLYNTIYNQTDLESSPELEEDVTRTIGQGRLFGTLYFDKNGSWFGKDSKVTLEPKFQYLYTSFENQDNIGLYDSTVLFTDFNGLFRGREFTGLDRISDNNQITLGVTSRIIDSSSREQFVFSLGQIFYLDDSRVSLFRGDDNRSALAGEIDWRINNRWLLHGDALLSANSQQVDRSSVTLGYQISAQKLIQLSHRYVRNLSDETIDQLGLSISWPLAKNWQWVGRVYRDLELNRSIETYTGIEYESCCWSLRVVAQRYLTNRFDTSGQQTLNEYDSGVSFQFSFKGLGSKKASRQLLEDGIFGYRQPYSLN